MNRVHELENMAMSTLLYAFMLYMSDAPATVCLYKSNLSRVLLRNHAIMQTLLTP